MMNFGQILVICYACLQGLLTIACCGFAGKTTYDIVSEKEEPLTKSSIVKLWWKITLKMRTIYLSLFVHIFDFVTDLLVIGEWYREENNNDVEHIDSKTMAYSSIAILIFYRIISSLAIFIISEKDCKQAMYQLFDVLLFFEIHESHKKFVNDFFSRYSVYAQDGSSDNQLLEDHVYLKTPSSTTDAMEIGSTASMFYLILSTFF